MIDEPGRAVPRFPAANEPEVQRAVGAWLDQWGFGKGDLAITGGACGADLIVAEAILARGCANRLMLAREMGAFIQSSVRRAGESWVERFRRVCERSEVLSMPETLGPTPAGVNIYERANEWMIDTAVSEPAGEKFVLLVYEPSQESNKPGGTGHFASIALRVNAHMAMVRTMHPMGPGGVGAERPLRP